MSVCLARRSVSVRLAPGWEGAAVARRRAQPPRDAAGRAPFLPLVWELLFEARAGTQEFVINDPSGSPRSRGDIPALISHSWSEVSGPAAEGERERGRAGGRTAWGLPASSSRLPFPGAGAGGEEGASHPPPRSTGTTPGPPASSSLFLIPGQAGREGSPGAPRAKKSLLRSQALAGKSAEGGEETSSLLEGKGEMGARPEAEEGAKPPPRSRRSATPFPERSGGPGGGAVARVHQPQPAEHLLLRACGRRGGRPASALAVAQPPGALAGRA